MLSTAGWRQHYPFESHWHDLNGQRYHYIQAGQGAPVLFVHGNPTWSFYWRNLVQGVADSHQAMAVDHIGCGLSDKPAAKSYSLQQHIDNLLSFIDARRLNNITVVGHDWGGAIALGAAVERPEPFARCVLFNTAAFPPPFFPWRIRICRTPVLGRLAMQGGNVFAKAALHMALANGNSMSASEKQGMIAPYDSWRNRLGIYNFVQDIPATPAHATWQTLESIESGLTLLANKPILMMWGMRDWCFRPECLDRLVTHFPQAEVHRFADAGHWVVEEKRTEILEILKAFLAK